MLARLLQLGCLIVQVNAFSPLIPIGVPTPNGESFVTTSTSLTSGSPHGDVVPQSRVHLEVHASGKDQNDLPGYLVLRRPIVLPVNLFNAPPTSTEQGSLSAHSEAASDIRAPSLKGQLFRPGRIEVEKNYLTEEEPPPQYQEPDYHRRVYVEPYTGEERREERREELPSYPRVEVPAVDPTLEVGEHEQRDTEHVRGAIRKAEQSLEKLDQVKFELEKELERVTDMRSRLHTRILASQIQQEVQSALPDLHDLDHPHRKNKRHRHAEDEVPKEEDEEEEEEDKLEEDESETEKEEMRKKKREQEEEEEEEEESEKEKEKSTTATAKKKKVVEEDEEEEEAPSKPTKGEKLGATQRGAKKPSHEKEEEEEDEDEAEKEKGKAKEYVGKKKTHEVKSTTTTPSPPKKEVSEDEDEESTSGSSSRSSSSSSVAKKAASSSEDEEEDEDSSRTKKKQETTTSAPAANSEEESFFEKLEHPAPPSTSSFLLSSSFPLAPSSPVVAEFNAEQFNKELDNILKLTNSDISDSTKIREKVSPLKERHHPPVHSFVQKLHKKHSLQNRTVPSP